MTWRVKILGLVMLSALVACGEDEAKQGEDMGGGQNNDTDMVRCVAGEVLDAETGLCVPFFPEEDMTTPEPDMTPDADMDVVEPDMSVEPEDMGPVIDPACDKDRDGDLSIECGGSDCDDNDPRRSGRNFEICDEADNDCDGVVNNDIVCEFLAHTGENPPKLYMIDPFKKTATELGDAAERFLDIDTHPNGTLYGVTADALWSRAPFGDWRQVGQGFGGLRLDQVNGLAIDRDGVIYATGGTNLYRIGIQTGRAEVLGSMGPGNTSSGDCVVNKGNNLYMTAKGDGRPDRLVQISYTPGPNNTAGTASTREVGETGFTNVFGLTAAWGRLFGVTLNGELIEIDTATGVGTLIHRFENRRWYGAASTPDR